VAVRQLRAGVLAEVHRRRARRPGVIMSPVLLAVAHGSQDPAAQQCVLSLTGRVARLADGARVRTAFVQNAKPSLAEGLDDATAQAGADGVVVVPLLLSSGYHLSSDIAGAARAAGVPVAPPLGPDPRLAGALSGRLREAGVPADVPVVLAAAGTSDLRGLADTRRQAAMLAARRRTPVVAAFASAARPTVDEAVSFLAALTGQPVAVAAYLLAPGLFHDRLRLSAGAWVSGPIGDHPAVAELVLDRFRDTAPGSVAPVRSLRVPGAGRGMANWTGGAHGDRRKSA
jgi:sirohydrochlorin ferrochelatase